MMIGNRNHMGGDQKSKQLLSVSYSFAQKLWDEWELQCLVLVSFALQAFFLFAAGIRRRNKSKVLQIMLWLAYLSADYVAVFVLGHLTLHIDDPRHQLVLLWAPVLLLHLGGQETITAFSMEDNELWKRHLLGLVTQVALAVYVVAKSWRSNSGLLAPVALMFVSGTVKYAERTWALKTATPDTIKDNRMADLYKTMWARTSRNPSDGESLEVQRYFQDIVGRRKWWEAEEYADLVQAAGDSFPNCMNTLMGVPVAPWLLPHIWKMIAEITSRRKWPSSSTVEEDPFPSRAYKMVDIQLSLIYDHLYTKVGIRYAQGWPVFGLGLPLLTLITTSSALALFAAVRKDDGAYSAVDVTVSYILLGGAVALEVMSVLTVTLSIRSYYFWQEKLGARSRFTRKIFWLVKLVRPYHKPLWSNKWRQYNLLAGCIKEKQAGLLTRTMRFHGLAAWDTKLCRVSDETKQLVCNELDDGRRLQQFSHCRGTGILSLMGYTQESDLHKSITKVDLSTSVVLWHLITDICFLHAKDDGGGGRHMLVAREVSNYLLDLVMQRRVMRSSEGHVAHRKARDELNQILSEHSETIDDGDTDAIKRMLEGGVRRIPDPAASGAPEGVDVTFARNSYETIRPVLPRAWRLAEMLLQEHRGRGGSGSAVLWQLLASVWIESLFHVAPRCDAAIHTKNLSTGGEFITHVRFLLLNRGIGWDFVLGHA